MEGTLQGGAWASFGGDFSGRGARALDVRASVIAALGLSTCGCRALVAPRHVESSWTWVGRQILILCTTREGWGHGESHEAVDQLLWVGRKQTEEG